MKGTGEGTLESMRKRGGKRGRRRGGRTGQEEKGKDGRGGT